MFLYNDVNLLAQSANKNNIIDEEIYNHLTLANQILTNSDLREKYDNWLKSFGEDGLTHNNLKDNFKKTISNTKELFPSMPSEAKKSYYEKNETLNNKHGINEDWDKESTISKYNQKKKELEKNISISGEKIKNKKDFNNKFENFKNDNDNQQIIKTDNNQSILEYNGEIIGNEYLSITNYNLLYSNDNIQSNNYSSLDRAFMLQPKIEFDEINVSKKMKEYKSLSEDLSKLYPKPKNNDV